MALHDLQSMLGGLGSGLQDPLEVMREQRAMAARQTQSCLQKMPSYANAYANGWATTSSSGTSDSIGAGYPVRREIKPDIDKMPLLEYLRARKREWLTGAP